MDYDKALKMLDKENISRDEILEVLNNFAGCLDNELIGKLKKHSNLLAEVFNCNEEDMYFGDLENKYPYYEVVFGDFIILGNKNYEEYNKCKLTNLIGNIKVYNSELDSLGFINNVYGSVFVENSDLYDLGGLSFVRDNIEIYNSKIATFNSIRRFKPVLSIGQDEEGPYQMISLVGEPGVIIGDSLYVHNSDVKSFSGIQGVDGSVNLVNSKITDMNYLSGVSYTYVENCEVSKFTTGIGNKLIVKNSVINQYDSCFQLFKKEVCWDNNNIPFREIEEDLMTRLHSKIISLSNDAEREK